METVLWEEIIMIEVTENEELKLEAAKLRRMIYRIYSLERNNTKTENMTDKVLKQKIIEIIEEEAKKCY